jgi:tetratricopeptide (TPR) repeat protein
MKGEAMSRRFKIVLAGYALLAATGVGAETLPVGGVYPAGNDDAASLATIAVERFGGVDGEQLGIAIADRLRAVAIDGEPYFRIFPSGAPAEAVLQGTAAAESSRHDSNPREQEVCVERDDDHDCIRKEKRKIPCWEIMVEFEANVRLVRTNGAVVFAEDHEAEQPQRYCEGEDRPSTERMVRQLAEAYADRLRAELAPEQRFEQVRVMEDRDGLSKVDGRAFRAGVQLTKTDRDAACAAWAALEAGNPDHPSVLFNLGLCEESRGRLREAHDYYQRVIAGDEDDGYARLGAARVEARWRANAQLDSQRPR